MHFPLFTPNQPTTGAAAGRTEPTHDAAAGHDAFRDVLARLQYETQSGSGDDGGVGEETSERTPDTKGSVAPAAESAPSDTEAVGSMEADESESAALRNQDNPDSAQITLQGRRTVDRGPVAILHNDVSSRPETAVAPRHAFPGVQYSLRERAEVPTTIETVSGRMHPIPFADPAMVKANPTGSDPVRGILDGLHSDKKNLALGSNSRAIPEETVSRQVALGARMATEIETAALQPRVTTQGMEGLLRHSVTGQEHFQIGGRKGKEIVNAVSVNQALSEDLAPEIDRFHPKPTSTGTDRAVGQSVAPDKPNKGSRSKPAAISHNLGTFKTDPSQPRSSGPTMQATRPENPVLPDRLPATNRAPEATGISPQSPPETGEPNPGKSSQASHRRREEATSISPVRTEPDRRRFANVGSQAEHSWIASRPVRAASSSAGRVLSASQATVQPPYTAERQASGQLIAPSTQTREPKLSTARHLTPNPASIENRGRDATTTSNGSRKTEQVAAPQEPVARASNALGGNSVTEIKSVSEGKIASDGVERAPTEARQRPPQSQLADRLVSEHKSGNDLAKARTADLASPDDSGREAVKMPDAAQAAERTVRDVVSSSVVRRAQPASGHEMQVQHPVNSNLQGVEGFAQAQRGPDRLPLIDYPVPTGREAETGDILAVRKTGTPAKHAPVGATRAGGETGTTGNSPDGVPQPRQGDVPAAPLTESGRGRPNEPARRPGTPGQVPPFDYMERPARGEKSPASTRHNPDPRSFERSERLARTGLQNIRPTSGALMTAQNSVGHTIAGDSTLRANAPVTTELAAFETDRPDHGFAQDARAGESVPHRAQTQGSADMTRHVGRQMAEALAKSGERPVEISLSPAELGRVRMNMHTTEHSVVVTIFAERPETLDLMRRHIEQLSQEFKELGYSDIDFSFHGGQSDQPDTGEESGNRDGPGRRGADPVTPEPLAMARNQHTGTAGSDPRDGLDLRL